MKRLAITSKILCFALVTCLFLLTPWAQAGEKHSSQFLGVWEGVDEQDGSLIKALITPGGKNEFKFLWYETYWRTCDGGRGIFKGTGLLSRHEGNVLVLKAQVFCFEKNSTEWEGTLKLTQVNNAFILGTAIQNDNTPAFVDLPLYKVNEPVKKSFR